ncbi:hypothetical protein [Nitratireductor luteus]|uniref:hypothetical protein n=1 Tax=Nitratireductor luteus TaxID=2976980 RepID=UPI0022402011|nr:hypothetical protein [Nitratireductor luteus]
MKSEARGLIWCCTFVLLDAAQAVFFGSAFQRMDSFLVGACAFGVPTVLGLAWLAVFDRGQIETALANGRDLAGLNLTAAGAWLLYLMAIQLIEPAVAFTIFSGAIPLAALMARRFGYPEAPRLRNMAEALGTAIIFLGLAALSFSTMAGWSGFVRGGLAGAVSGVALAGAAGIMISGMLLYSARLDKAGVRPMAQFGLRFPLYTLLAVGGFLAGLDDKGPVPAGDLAYVFLAGLLLLAFPIYAVQKAVSLTSTLTIGTFAAIGPLVVFLMQTFEGRVDYAPATLTGLGIYFLGAITATIGSVRASAARRAGALCAMPDGTRVSTFPVDRSTAP